MRLLVVRNDKLGDFMLAWPSLALLKHYLPQSHICVLVPHYTAPMAQLCPWIDEVLIDEEDQGIFALARQLHEKNFDAMLTLFSTGRIALAGCLARIRYRLAPATKLAQFCYNHRLTQRRSRSEKPEYAYNLDLVRRLLADHGMRTEPGDVSADGDFLTRELQRPLLRFADDTVVLRREFCRRHALDEAAILVFIHPGSGGSANNLQPGQYTQLARELTASSPLAFVISAGPGEEAVARQIAAGIGAPAVVYESGKGLQEFARTLQLADLFISGSTGPLHIAAALDRPTAAFYPRHRSATPLRWQTTNAPQKRLAFTPPEHSDERDVQQIDIAAAAKQISNQLLH